MEKLQAKIKNYSKTTALLLSGTAANAGVIYTDISPDILLNTDGDLYNIDLNNDAINDFRVTVDKSSSSSSYNSSIGLEDLTIGNSYIATSSSSAYVKALNTGVVVSNSNSYWGTGQRNNIGYFASSSSSYGDWAGLANKYVGVKFLIGAATHFGWIRLSVSAGYSSVTIHDYAYEQIPGKSILTGDTLGSEVINTINITECDSANVFGNTFTTSQVVSDTIVGGSAAGIDSITVANITINNSSSTDIDTSITAGSSIIIDGVSVNTAGTYSEVLQTAEGCDSTVNYNVSIIQGLNDSFSENVKVYPNPVTKTLFIENKDANIKSIQLYNNHGKLFYSENNLNSQNVVSIQLDTYPKGVYLLELTSDENKGMKKIVIE